MIKLKSASVLAVAVTAWLLTTCGAKAQMAIGSYEIDGGSLVPLWDLSGDYSTALNGGTVGLTIIQDPSGRFSGAGDFFASELGEEEVDLSGTDSTRGSMSGSSIAPHVDIDIDLVASGTADGDFVSSFKEVIKLKTEVDGVAGELVGNGAENLTETYQNPLTGKYTTKTEIQRVVDGEIMLPASVDGGWSLTLNLTPKGNKYLGTATIQTDPGTVVEFTVTGTYSAKTGNSTITLKGIGTAAGTELKIKFSTPDSSLLIESVRGKLFGQDLKYGP